MMYPEKSQKVGNRPIEERNSPQKPAFVGLNLLRGAAALIVMLVHVRTASFVDYASLPPADQTPLVFALFMGTRIGHEAVLVFFVLSGYLVGGQVLRQVREGRFRLTHYGADRISRIYLPLLPAIALTVILNAYAFGLPTDPAQIAGHVVGFNGPIVPTLQNNAPLWSLSYEIWFYVLAAGGALAVTGRSSGIAIAVLASAVVMFTWLDARYVIFWASGALIGGLNINSGRGLLALGGALLMAGGSVAFQLASDSNAFKAIAFVSSSTAEGLFCVGVALTIPLLVDPRTDRALRWLRVPASALAAISYSLYLCHYPLNAFVAPLFGKAATIGDSSLIAFGLRILLLLGAAVIFYYMFEVHTPTLRRALRRMFEGKPAVATEPA